MKHYFVVPAIDPSNTAKMLDTMSHEAFARVILIDNTATGAIAPGGIAARHGANRNLGVAASWNYGARLAWDLGADYVTLTSTSMRFTDPCDCETYHCEHEYTDGGDQFATLADFASEHDQWPYGFESMHGWHLITLGRKLFETVGYFDEAFHPAYFEDNDMIWRLRCAGILEPAGGDRSKRLIPWIPTLRYECVGDAQAIKTCDIPVNLVALGAYYAEKWGGPPGHERFTSPFDDTPPVTRPYPPGDGADFSYPRPRKGES